MLIEQHIEELRAERGMPSSAKSVSGSSRNSPRRKQSSKRSSAIPSNEGYSHDRQFKSGLVTLVAPRLRLEPPCAMIVLAGRNQAAAVKKAVRSRTMARFGRGFEGNRTMRQSPASNIASR